MTLDILTPCRRLFGHKHDTRFTWGEFAWHPKPSRWQAGLIYDPAGPAEKNMLIVHAIIFSLYLHLPTNRAGDGCMRGDEPRYGFYTFGDQIILVWGEHKNGRWYYSWGWPFWSARHYSTEVLSLDRVPVWIEYSGDKREFKERWEEEIAAKQDHSYTYYPYTYRLRNGTEQHRIATFNLGRMVWRRKWLGPLFPKVSTYLDIKFDDEVGEGSGSWKGGTIGCSFEILPGESPRDCIRRMQATRKFT